MFDDFWAIFDCFWTTWTSWTSWTSLDPFWTRFCLGTLEDGTITLVDSLDRFGLSCADFDPGRENVGVMALDD